MDAVELGAFLKSRRDRIRPGDVGLPAGPRRRVPGLRRDEVARLAGASVDYYTELEQGRGAQPSPEMLAALARALRLSNDERDHAFRLAGRLPPSVPGPAAHVHPGMLDLLDRLEGTPAEVITDLHAVLVQNPLARALLGTPPVGSPLDRSFVYRWFTDPDARAIYPHDDHEHHSSVFVSDLRAVHARRRQDSDVRELVSRLLDRSSEFAGLWARHDVAVRRSDRKRIVHPSIGVIEVNCLCLVSEDGTQRLLWFTPPPGTPAVEQLELLTVIGTQHLDPVPHP